ncbi:hypothetical protein D3C71_1127150 [compost metagenome]
MRALLVLPRRVCLLVPKVPSAVVLPRSCLVQTSHSVQWMPMTLLLMRIPLVLRKRKVLPGSVVVWLVLLLALVPLGLLALLLVRELVRSFSEWALPLVLSSVVASGL